MSTSSPRCAELTLRPDWRWRALLCAAHGLAGIGLLAGGVPLSLALPAAVTLAVSLLFTLRRSAHPFTLRVSRRRSECVVLQRGVASRATLARELWRSPWLVGFELEFGGTSRRLWLARPWMSRADLRRLRLWLLSLPRSEPH